MHDAAPLDIDNQVRKSRPAKYQLARHCERRLADKKGLSNSGGSAMAEGCCWQTEYSNSLNAPRPGISGVFEERHEAKVHMDLLMTVE